MRKKNSRWKKGNDRYPKDVKDYIMQHYREAHGWRKGAKVNGPGGEP